MSSKRYFSYVRVSTVRQGQTGTSLAEQQTAIRRHAERWGLTIVKEYEEKETAAKQGRPVFLAMLKALRQGKANGVVIHKIDRSARNLRDWAELGDLIDRGIEVQFANENLDLYTRGGRLSADIQAVVAADYIRNLREEVRKGFYGRLKQGLYPMPAPLGYLDRGQGKPKEPDSTQAPLVKQAFELYATGKISIAVLARKMHEKGLRNKYGGMVVKNSMNGLLRNPFYAGIVRLRSTGEYFVGQHTPIVPKSLFDRVQAILDGKFVDNKQRHFFIFRRLLNCNGCSNKLIAEVQKGYTYYRCQIRDCPQKTIREESVESTLLRVFRDLCFNDAEAKYFQQTVEKQYHASTEDKAARIQSLNLQLEQCQARLSKLADAYIDGVLDQETYLIKKQKIITEVQTIKERLAQGDRFEQSILDEMAKFLELLKSAYTSYNLATPEEKRDLVKTITSNLSVEGKTVLIKLNYPFQLVANRQKVMDGGPQRDTPRTFALLVKKLIEYFKENSISKRPVE